MEKLKEGLARLMRGRYGMDDLYKALVAAGLVLSCANLAFKSPILGVAMWGVLSLAVYRSFSRNAAGRRRENEAYLRITKPARSGARTTILRIKEARTSRYRRCPSCRALICMPARKGRRVIDCPRCHTKFEARIHF